MTLFVNGMGQGPDVPPGGSKGRIRRSTDSELRTAIFSKNVPVDVRESASKELSRREQSRIADAKAAIEAKEAVKAQAEKQALAEKCENLEKYGGFTVNSRNGEVHLDTPERELHGEIQTTSKYDDVFGAVATATPVIRHEKFDVRTDEDKNLSAVSHPDLGNPVGKAKKDENGAKVQTYDSGAQVAVSKDKNGTTTTTTYPDGSSETVTVLSKKGSMKETINGEQFTVASNSTVVVQKNSDGKEIYRTVNANE